MSEYANSLKFDADTFNDPGQTGMITMRLEQAIGMAHMKVRAVGPVRITIEVEDAHTRPLLNPDGTACLAGHPGVMPWSEVREAERKWRESPGLKTGTFKEGTNDTE